MENEGKELDNLTPSEIVKEGIKKGVSQIIKKPWFKRMVALLLAFCIGFGLGIYQRSKSADPQSENTNDHTSSVAVPVPSEKPFTLTISHIKKIIAPASDLITIKYAYTDADTYENYKQFFNLKLPFTTYKVVFTYSGEAGIGINLSDVSTYLDNEEKTITIVLPEIEVKYNQIDAESFEYYNVSTTIFNQLKMEDTTDLIATLLEEKGKQVLNDKKVMDEAQANTEMVLRSLLNNSELTKDYKIIFKQKEG